MDPNLNHNPNLFDILSTVSPISRIYNDAIWCVETMKYILFESNIWPFSASLLGLLFEPNDTETFSIGSNVRDELGFLIFDI
ncbi:hypothetical protein Cyrtocomes_00609 [Candidatus Cyrtobacter comes]|uniref:Uncharacterized protein n=1 Tax=Candidatus Cyrtobacter comes TaxID=675776 RepID=A0ABU5L8Q5_9RICK|nr:hypothetical protein [Candidatus Cyrtobacter comes]MDZ5762234.1 hypothetical protein [Candidatus Cyrtobacter comes]